MIAHPILMAIGMADLFGLGLILSAGWIAGDVLLHWNPDGRDRRQIALEARSERGGAEARWGAGLFAFSTLLLVIAVTRILPELIPGAMCGTGVFQAMQGAGFRAFALRFITLLLLFLWHLLDRLNRTSRRGPLTETSARGLLIALPGAVLGIFDTFKAVSLLDLERPVDCCAALYDRFGNGNSLPFWENIPDAFWMGGFMVTGILLIAAGVWSFLRPGRKSAALLAIFSLIWPFAAAGALVQVLSAYHYQVLSHSCPWCLFLPEHWRVGFFLFGALLGGMAAGPAALLSIIVGQRYPAIREPARIMSRRASAWAVLLSILFIIGASFPALLWRLRHGVWIGG